MNTTPWKFKMDMVTVVEEVVMPAGAELLTLQLQHGAPTLWALVNPDGDNETRYFQWVGTGHSEVTSNMKFVGTIQYERFVFHLFERVTVES